MSSQSGIVTPEAVVLDYERAGVASRILAIWVDALILGAGWTILFLLAVQIFGQIEGLLGAVLAVFLSLGAYLGYFVGFETGMQRTPGKMVFGLRVVGVDATPVRFQQAFLRGVLGIVEFLAIPVGFIAVVAALLTPSDQRLGDLAAGTLVVRQRTASSLVAPARFPPPPGYEAYAGSLEVSEMTDEHYELVRRFLLRAHTLTPMARSQVAASLANPMAALLHHTPPPHLHPEVFLACVAAAWQHAHGAPLTAEAWHQPAGMVYPSQQGYAPAPGPYPVPAPPYAVSTPYPAPPGATGQAGPPFTAPPVPTAPPIIPTAPPTVPTVPPTAPPVPPVPTGPPTAPTAPPTAPTPSPPTVPTAPPTLPAPPRPDGSAWPEPGASPGDSPGPSSEQDAPSDMPTLPSS